MLLMKIFKKLVIIFHNQKKIKLKNMDLNFVIPGIYISKASLQTPNNDTPKEFIRVLGESNTKENYFKIDDGRELPEYVILNEYELYSIGNSENSIKNSIRKSKQLMNGFKPSENQNKENTKITKDKKEENINLDNKSQDAIKINENDLKDNFHGKIFINEEEKRKYKIFIPHGLTDFEIAVLRQFTEKEEIKVIIPSFELTSTINFENLAKAIKLFNLNKESISKNIANYLINHNQMFYETLSKVLEQLLDIEIQNTEKENIDYIKDLNEEIIQEKNDNFKIKEDNNLEEIQEEIQEEINDNNNDDEEKDISEKIQNVDFYLKKHNLI